MTDRWENIHEPGTVEYRLVKLANTHHNGIADGDDIVSVCNQLKAARGLLIRAEREADETPITKEWLVSVGGVVRCDNGVRMDVEFAHPVWEISAWVHASHDLPDRPVRLSVIRRRGLAPEIQNLPVPTRGTFRTAMRMLNIEVKE